MVSGDFHCGLLELEQFVAKVAGDTKLGQPRARLLRQVVGRLDIDVVWRDRIRSCPTVIDDIDQFLGDVDAEAVIPPILEPVSQLVASIMVKDIYIEFALLRKPGQRQIAATQVADLGVERILSKQ